MKPTKQAKRGVIIKWDKFKEELYTIFGKCPCGNTDVTFGSNYCSKCGVKFITLKKTKKI